MHNFAYRQKIQPLLFFCFLLAQMFTALACDQTKGGGSGGLDPEDLPYLLEGVLCADISPGQNPVGIVDNFPADSRVYLWLHWANIEGEHIIEIFWDDPEGVQQLEERLDLSTEEDRFISWFFLETTANAKLGEWSVSVFLDGQFVRSYIFEVF